MTNMFETLSAHPAAMACGLFGTLCLITFPLFPTRRSMLVVQSGIGLGFGLQYLLLDAYTAAASQAVSVSVTMLAIPLVRWPRLRLAACLAVPPSMAALSFLTWQGLPSILVAVGLGLAMLGRLQADEMKMRWLLVAGTPVLAWHDAMVDAAPAFVGNSLSFLIGAAVLFRRYREQMAGPVPARPPLLPAPGATAR